MTNEKNMKELLKKLHVATVEAALAKVTSGECAASDMKLAWEILKDNNVPLENMREGLGITEDKPDEDMFESLPPNLKIA